MAVYDHSQGGSISWSTPAGLILAAFGVYLVVLLVFSCSKSEHV
jgi:hypothetical protein